MEQDSIVFYGFWSFENTNMIPSELRLKLKKYIEVSKDVIWASEYSLGLEQEIIPHIG